MFEEATHSVKQTCQEFRKRFKKWVHMHIIYARPFAMLVYEIGLS